MDGCPEHPDAGLRRKWEDLDPTRDPEAIAAAAERAREENAASREERAPGSGLLGHGRTEDEADPDAAEEESGTDGD